MKNILAALFAGCLTMSVAAVIVVTASFATEPSKHAITPAYDRAGNDVIDAAIARQLAAAKARVAEMRQSEALALAPIKTR